MDGAVKVASSNNVNSLDALSEPLPGASNSKTRQHCETEVKCFICGNEIGHLSETEQNVHLNECLDEEQRSPVYSPACQSSLSADSVLNKPKHSVDSISGKGLMELPKPRTTSLPTEKQEKQPEPPANFKKPFAVSRKKAKIDCTPETNTEMPTTSSKMQRGTSLNNNKAESKTEKKPRAKTKRKVEEIYEPEPVADCQCKVFSVLKQCFINKFKAGNFDATLNDRDGAMDNDDLDQVRRELRSMDEELKRTKKENVSLRLHNEELTQRIKTLEATISSTQCAPAFRNSVDSANEINLIITQPLDDPADMPSTSKTRTPVRIQPTALSPVRRPVKKTLSRSPKKKSVQSNGTSLTTTQINAEQQEIKIIKELSITPLPNFAQMSEAELNEQLNCYGVRPMGRKRAMQLLQRIYEETHPTTDSTPVRRVRSKTRLPLQKDVTEKATEPPSEEMPARTQSVTQQTQKDRSKKIDPDTLRTTFLQWLREPVNDDLYNELLTLNPVLLDRLIDGFGAHLPTKKCATTTFTDVLDQLHITFCARNEGARGHYK